MNPWAFFLLQGSLLFCCLHLASSSCSDYTNITDPWRNRDFTLTLPTGYNNDLSLVGQWWRFTGIGGDAVITECVPLYRGGTKYTMFIDSATGWFTGQSSVNVYGHGETICNQYTSTVTVANCDGNFYVYKPTSHSSINMGYVTYHQDCTSGSCGPLAECTSSGGCQCVAGFEMPAGSVPSTDSFGCVDIDECSVDVTICGPIANCINSVGSYSCVCPDGYTQTDTNTTTLCTDIDQCAETPDICGAQAVCTNIPGEFLCSCTDGFFPSPDVLWVLGVSVCKNLQDILNEITPSQGGTIKEAFLNLIEEALSENKNVSLDDETVKNYFSAIMQASEFGSQSDPNTVGEGDRETGSLILDLSELLVSAAMPEDENQTEKVIKTSTVDLSIKIIRPGNQTEETSVLSANGNTMQINMESLAKENNGFAAAAFLTLNGLEKLLSAQYFKSENETQILSDVMTGLLLSMNNTNLTEPVNFTMLHKKILPDSGLVTCVYWKKNKAKTNGSKNEDGWSVEGCWRVFYNENYTMCSCSHLSTFTLILQIAEPAPDNPILDWLNRVCVIIGLFFFALAILTFLLCSWNPKINNTARLHLCINLALSHILLLLNDLHIENKLACQSMAGIIHFLVVAGFVWMFLEALQLYMLVHKLTKVQVIQRDGLPNLLLYLIGYGVPLVVVGVSAVVYPDGYGAVGQICWLSEERGFKWALTGPVITLLSFNCVLFFVTLWTLRPTLASMKSDVSQSKDTKLILFKILAQFVILGCPWILGLYQTNLFFQVLFIVLNSQQGTFLYIVHCILNKEVREECRRWLTCSTNESENKETKKDLPSVSEDFGKEETKE